MKPRNEEAKAPEKGLLSHKKNMGFIGLLNIFVLLFMISG
jgi:hypothetical protein